MEYFENVWSILAYGCARSAQSLVAAGLVDEYRLAIHPVALGQGKPLFSGLRRPANLRLVDMTRSTRVPWPPSTGQGEV